MATIVLRSVKGSPLTIAEADANFNNLNTEVGTKLDASSYTATNILSLLSAGDDGSGKGLNAASLASKVLSASATNSTIALRDGSGGLTATTFTGNLTGNVTGNLTGNVTGNVTGNASNVTNTVTIEHGGTGGTTATAARSNLGLGTIATQNSNAVSITGGSISGIADISVADGGTGASTASQARTNLGLVIGSDVQPFSNELTGIAAAGNNGFYVRTGVGSVTQRSITAGGNGLTISNGDGISGNPLISIATNASMTLGALTTASLSVSGSTSLSMVSTGNISVSGNISATGNLTVSTSNSTGGGIILADDGDIVDLNTAYCAMRFTSGVQIYSGNRTGSAVITLGSNGSITATGNVTGYYSDDRLKTKLGRIENALDKLCSLEGFYFQANQTAQDLGYTDEKQVGVSAQSVQAVLPEVVGPAAIDPKYLTVDYARMIPLIIEAIKEIREEIKTLK